MKLNVRRHLHTFSVASAIAAALMVSTPASAQDDAVTESLRSKRNVRVEVKPFMRVVG